MSAKKMGILFTNQHRQYYTTNNVKSKDIVFGLNGTKIFKSSAKTKPCNSCIAPPSSTSIDTLLAQERKARGVARKKELAEANERDMAEVHERVVAREREVVREREAAAVREREAAAARERVVVREREAAAARERAVAIAYERSAVEAVAVRKKVADRERELAEAAARERAKAREREVAEGADREWAKARERESAARERGKAREREVAEAAARERAKAREREVAAREKKATEAAEATAREKKATEAAEAAEAAAREKEATEATEAAAREKEATEATEAAAKEQVMAEAAAKEQVMAEAAAREEELGVVFEKSITSVLTDNFEAGVMQKDKHVLLLLYAPWCGWCKRMAPDFIKATETLASTNSVELMVVDATQWEVTHPKVQIQGFPTAFLFKNGDKENPIEYNGDRSTNDLVKFVETHLGVEVPNVQLEITEVDTKKLIDMTNNFEDVVMKNEDDVFVMFYAPWCGWCKKMMPDVEALAQHYSSKNKIRIVRMDATAHQPKHDKVKIYGFPLVHLFKANDKANPVEYRGDRTKDDMIMFVEEHAVNK